MYGYKIITYYILAFLYNYYLGTEKVSSEIFCLSILRYFPMGTGKHVTGWHGIKILNPFCYL